MEPIKINHWVAFLNVAGRPEQILQVFEEPRFASFPGWIRGYIGAPDVLAQILRQFTEYLNEVDARNGNCNGRIDFKDGYLMLCCHTGTVYITYEGKNSGGLSGNYN